MSVLHSKLALLLHAESTEVKTQSIRTNYLEKEAKVPQEPYKTVNLFDWTAGIRGRSNNPLAFPQNALTAGENIDLTGGGLSSRCGTSVAGSGGLPSGAILALKQVRFPTNESSYLLAQVQYDLGFQAANDGPYRRDHTAIWDSAQELMVVFGGQDETTATVDTVHTYDPVTDTWTDITTSGTPPAARSRHSAIYDPVGQRMIVFGGVDGTASPLGDLWSLDLTTWEWTELTDSGSVPSARSNHTAIYRTADASMILCGGATGAGAQSARDIYSLNLSTYVWTLISYTSGDFPGPRNGHVAVYDEVNDRMLIMFGVTGEIELSDLWQTAFTGTWTELADVTDLMYEITEGPVHGCGAFYDGAVFHAFGSRLDINGDDKCLLMYNQGTNSWTSSVISGDPERRMLCTAVVTGEGLVIVFGGEIRSGEYPTTNEVWIVNGAFGTVAQGCGLYASNDPLPSSTATFTPIYDLGDGAGLCSVAVLNDRCVITEGVNNPPLVWPGCMTSDASDWATPKAVLVSPDDANYYDAPEVLDKDPDTVADMSNIRMQGHIDVCLDVPKVEALYIEMGTPNSGLAVEAQVFSNTVDMTTTDNLLRHNRVGPIVQWYNDATAKGHFEGLEIDIDAGAAVDKGGGLVGIPSTGHGLTTGQKIRIEGTVAYNGFYTLDASTTLNELVITKAYVAETFNIGTEKVRRRFTLGPGNDCPDVVAGMIVKFADMELTILSTTGDGSAAQAVIISQNHTTAPVSAIYGLVNKDSQLTVNYAATSTMVSTFSKTLDGNPFIAPRAISIRQVIKGADLSASGSYVQVTLQFSNGASTGTQYNDSFMLLGASIVERSGSTGDGVTTPTALAFPGAGSFDVLAPGATITSKLTKFTIDEAKDYLVILDLISYRTYYNFTLYPYDPNYGKLASVYLKQKLEGGGYYFKAGTGIYDKDPWQSKTLAAMPAGFTDYSGHAVTIGVSEIQVQTNRSASTGLHVACTTDTNHLPLYAADSFVGVSPSQDAPGSSIIRHAISMDQRLTWMVFKSDVWRTIARNNSGTWQYKDSGGAWQNATENDMLFALYQAFGVTENQMTGTELSAVTQEQWSDTGGFVPRITQYVDMAVGMQIDGSGNIPSMTSYAVVFNDVGTALVEGFSGSIWTPGSGWTDGTLLSGIPLAQSGVISYDGGVMTLDYTVINEVRAIG